MVGPDSANGSALVGDAAGREVNRQACRGSGARAAVLLEPYEDQTFRAELEVDERNAAEAALKFGEHPGEHRDTARQGGEGVAEHLALPGRADAVPEGPVRGEQPGLEVP